MTPRHDWTDALWQLIGVVILYHIISMSIKNYLEDQDQEKL